MNEFIFDNYEDYRINYKNMNISAWSPKLDLIALGSTNGDLCIYRLQMILIWKITIKNEGNILSICWHPDGNIIAVGFESGLIQYFSINYPDSLYFIKFDEPINYLKWVDLSNDYRLQQAINFPYDIKDIFPLKEQIYKNSVYKEDIKKIEEILRLKIKFSILMGVKGMSIFFLSRGIYNLGKINLEDRRTSSYDKIYHASISYNFDSISYVIQMYNENGDQAFRTFVINCDFIRKNLLQISTISSIFIDLVYLRLLVQKHMKEIEESWEDCLSLFERGIMEYSRKKQHIRDWSLRTDLMEMILFGCCNKEFWIILEGSLSLCGVKGISSTVTKMSSHIINHCCPHMHYTLIKLLFHTIELFNIIKFQSEYEFFNLSRSEISELVQTCESALFKLVEFQILLSDNIEHLNLFFQWISNGIENHLNETNLCHTFTYSQLSVIMDFVTNKLRVVKSSCGEIIAYKIEMLHEYISENDLSIPQNCDKNMLMTFIDMPNTDFDSSFFMKEDFYPVKHEKSLSKVIRILLPDTIDKVCWKHENTVIKYHTDPAGSYPVTIATFNFDIDDDKILIASEYFDNDGENDSMDVCAFYHPNTPILIWTRNTFGTVQSCTIYLDKLLYSEINQNIKLLKLQFYNSNILFLLAAVEKDNIVENSYILVLSWSSIEVSHMQKIRVHSFEELINENFTIWPTNIENWIYLSNLLTLKSQELLPIDAIDINVSCKRRLALVFFGRSRERCRIFVLEDI